MSLSSNANCLSCSAMVLQENTGYIPYETAFNNQSERKPMSEYNHKNIVAGTLPVLPVRNVAEALKYYTETLNFTELFRQPGEDGVVVNGQVQLEGCNLMFNLNPSNAGKQGGGVYFWIRIESQNIDDYYQELSERKVNIVEEIKDQFWGDRSFTCLLYTSPSPRDPE